MKNQRPKLGGYNLRSGLVIYPSQQDLISQALADLAQKLPSQFLFLSDVTGQIIASRGEQGQVDLVALGSLVAGDLAASQEIARLTGQYEDYQMVLREGQNIHTFIIEAGHHMALLVQISKETPLGWARMLIQKGAYELADIAATPPEAETEALPDLNLDQEELPDLFSDALDEMWKE